MSDLISRSALLESLMHCDALGRKSLDAVLQTINEQPTADAVVHGEWIKDRWIYICSECKEGFGSELKYVQGGHELPNFCPNCGSDMRKQGGMI